MDQTTIKLTEKEKRLLMIILQDYQLTIVTIRGTKKYAKELYNQLNNEVKQ